MSPNEAKGALEEALGLLVAGASGWGALWSSVLAAAVGGLLLLPFVLRGAVGLGDAMVLAAVGSLGGWPFILWAAWWTAVAGVRLACLRCGDGSARLRTFRR